MGDPCGRPRDKGRPVGTQIKCKKTNYNIDCKNRPTKTHEKIITRRIINTISFTHICSGISFGC
ncbi:hypothetical protein GCM10023331_17120 [Algivirga pacifica]|uniref:Uncharacterized protein n=1 Tax=Algivirga pacifica TaxID=1162670 RepID=A0ABP9D7E2_9BACT